MRINIHGSNNFHVSERLRGYIEKKVSKLNYFSETINDINFYLDAEKHLYKASSVLNFKKFGQTKFEATAEEMYTAIDKLIHKMDIKIQREKTRIQDHNNLSHAEMLEKISSTEKNEKINIKHVAIEQKPTTLEDAILQMKVLKEDYFGFNLLNENTKFTPAFLKRIDDEVVYFFKQEGNNYGEYILRLENDTIKENKKLRDIELKKMNIVDAQKSILEGEFYYNIFTDNENKVNFLIKEAENRWRVIS